MQYLNKSFSDAAWRGNKIMPGTCEGCLYGHGLPHTGECELKKKLQKIFDELDKVVEDEPYWSPKGY